jgi:hypothetical protein
MEGSSSSSSDLGFHLMFVTASICRPRHRIRSETTERSSVVNGRELWTKYYCKQRCKVTFETEPGRYNPTGSREPEVANLNLQDKGTAETLSLAGQC